MTEQPHPTTMLTKITPAGRQGRILRPRKARGKLPGNALIQGDAHIEPAALICPLVESPKVQAGFPSPAADYVEEGIDLNRYLITNPPATFFARVQGESLIDEGLHDRDIVTVDRSLTPTKGKIVVAVFEDTIYIKKLGQVDGRLALCSANAAQAQDYPPMFLDQDPDHVIWGVVTSVVRKL